MHLAFDDHDSQKVAWIALAIPANAEVDSALANMEAARTLCNSVQAEAESVEIDARIDVALATMHTARSILLSRQVALVQPQIELLRRAVLGVVLECDMLVVADAELASALRARCGLGRVAAAGWLYDVE